MLSVRNYEIRSFSKTHISSSTSPFLRPASNHSDCYRLLLLGQRVGLWIAKQCTVYRKGLRIVSVAHAVDAFQPKNKGPRTSERVKGPKQLPLPLPLPLFHRVEHQLWKNSALEEGVDLFEHRKAFRGIAATPFSYIDARTNRVELPFLLLRLLRGNGGNGAGDAL
jgi:hypothetical protein